MKHPEADQVGAQPSGETTDPTLESMVKYLQNVQKLSPEEELWLRLSYPLEADTLLDPQQDLEIKK